MTWAWIWTPTLAEFRAYAKVTGDDNPIHLDPDYAARHPFGRPVSHGMLIHAQLIAGAQRHGLPRVQALRLTFPAPAYAEEPLRLTLDPTPEGLRALAARADGTVVYEADWRVDLA